MNEICLIFLQLILLHIHCSKAVSSVIGSTITLHCNLPSTITLQWFKDQKPLSYGPNINGDLKPEEFRLRLSITDDNGKYHLTISNLTKTDEGVYSCSVGVTESPGQTLTVIDVRSNEAFSSVVGSTVTLQCPLQPTEGLRIQWDRNGQTLSSGNTILDGLRPIEYRDRLSIVADNEKYHLKIAYLVKSDEGQYRCSFVGTTDSYQTLIVIVGPTSVGFDKKLENKLQSREGQDLRIRCIAEGGSPPPNVKIQIGTNGPDYTGTNGVVEYTMLGIDSSYDGTTVSCRTDYPGVQYQPLTDTAYIYLYLKPLQPSFSPDPISTEDTKPLVLTCTSTGSRPAPTERIWLLGNSNLDLTSHSTMSSSLDPLKADTYIATSVLTYTVHKQYNGRSIICGFKNIVTANTFIQSAKQIDVKYAPTVTVPNKTLELTQKSVDIQCQLNGNPTTYTYKQWVHRSKYGKHIRYLSATPIITLAPVSEDVRYQETGVYICTVNNGIVNSENQLDQKGTGSLTSNAPPFFLSGPFQTVFGQTRKDVTIFVTVFSEPKFTGLTWYKDSSQISHGSKYLMSNADDIITTTFHGVNVQVDGYRLTFTITNLQEDDFTNYTVMISNGVGKPVYHAVILKSVGSPDPPTDFNVTDTQTNSISVKWKPGFDGGSEQRFVIQYRKLGTSLWNLEKVDSTVPISQDYKSWFTLDDLTEGTCYALRMYAENIYDSSSFTDVLEITTGHKETQNDSQSDVAVVAGGLSAVILTLIGVIMVLLWRFNACNMCKRAECHHKRNETDTTQHYMDVSDDDRRKQPSMHSSSERTITSPVADYEELGMRDQPNIYSQVESSKQQRDSESHFYSNQA